LATQRTAKAGLQYWQFRALINACRDDKAAIDAVYDRAANGAAWSDQRADGPPKVLASQDVLTFNAFISLFIDIVDGVGGVQSGTGGEQKIFNLHANLAPFQAACVRPVGT
jgi:hypothetical protein